MGTWSIGHWIVVLLIVMVLFGAGKIPRLMGDMAKGVKAFKKGLKDGDEDEVASADAGASQKVLKDDSSAPVRDEHKDKAANG
ncbi:MAG: twin-arginine translocase TatA/TatE family subunit [Alphaproteobacteria bacterium]|nr:twin-arginine translocase TatA/TatE family subunit [Alphaproteobacteria bacterium]MBF0129600.1 twin-arginine translocase TatA/TatE family subunit [Alphaproteobacteria bacterium]